MNLLRHIALGLAALIASPALAQQPGECGDDGNILAFDLAVPDDMALNMVDVGGIFMIAPDGCAAPVYELLFPDKLAAAEAGEVEAMDHVGLMFAAGAGTGQDWGEARRWLERAAAAGSAHAHYRLALMDQHGLDGRTDSRAGLEHLRAASVAGLSWATTNLGKLYLDGDGVSSDVAEALRYFELAREQGDVMATQNLAAIHAQGLLTGTPDFARAVPMAREAAVQGDVGGMRMLAYFLANGSGVERNIGLAYAWASLAAGRGDQPAAQLKAMIGERVGAELVARWEARLAACDQTPRQNCLTGQ